MLRDRPIFDPKDIWSDSLTNFRWYECRHFVNDGCYGWRLQWYDHGHVEYFCISWVSADDWYSTYKESSDDPTGSWIWENIEFTLLESMSVNVSTLISLILRIHHRQRHHDSIRLIKYRSITTWTKNWLMTSKDPSKWRTTYVDMKKFE